MKNVRWIITLCLFLATVINYLDRQALPLIITDSYFVKIMNLLGSDGLLDKRLIGFIDSAFKIAYAIGFLFIGRFIDKLGVLKGYSIAFFLWSLATLSFIFMDAFIGLCISNFALGFFQSSVHPASIKTISEWFPIKERSFAISCYNSGTNTGAILAPLLIPIFIIWGGWKFGFIIPACIGFIWIIAWYFIYKKPTEHKWISKSELDYIQSDKDNQIVQIKKSWAELLRYRETWSFAIAKFITDPVWFIYLTWLPLFFKEKHGIDLKTMFIPIMTIYIISLVGGIIGGFTSSFLIKKGLSVNKARKYTMLFFASLAIPSFFAAQTPNIWIAIVIVGIATAAHQAFSANLFTTTTDNFPKEIVASVVSIGGFFGALGGIIMAALAGIIYQFYGPAPLFIIGSSAYLIALLIIHLLNPKLKRVTI